MKPRQGKKRLGQSDHAHPVLIVYGTVAVNDENQISLFDDVYGFDAGLEKGLQEGYPYAW